MNPDVKGPPFPVSQQAYEDVLTPAFKLQSVELSEASLEPRAAMEKVAWWMRS